MLLDLDSSHFVFLSKSNVLRAAIICISSSSLIKNHNELFSGYKQIPNNIYLLQILRLQECLSKYEQSDDGSTPQVILTLDYINMLLFVKQCRAESNLNVCINICGLYGQVSSIFMTMIRIST